MIIPAIDLINGQIVRLAQGDFNAVTPFNYSPLTQLKAYQDAGSQQLHLVDLDGAKDPAQRQLDIIKLLIEGLDAPIQIGGGVRREEDVSALLEIGANRVVIGSLAVSNTKLVSQWLQKYGAQKITVALDIRIDAQGVPEVLTHGWQQGSGKHLSVVIEPLIDSGLQHVLCTDVDRDGMLTGPNINLYQRLITQYSNIVWQASGGIAELTDISALQKMGIGGIIIGKALLTGRFTIEEALQCWQNV